MTSDVGALLADAYEGEARLLRMSQEREIFRAFDPGGASHDTATPFFKRRDLIAPVGEPDGEVIAAFVAAADAASITRFLTTARMGDSGATYALDDKGNMLSRSRFEPQLRALGPAAGKRRCPHLLQRLCPRSRPRHRPERPAGNGSRHLAVHPPGRRRHHRRRRRGRSGRVQRLPRRRGHRRLALLGDLDIGIVTEIETGEAYES